MYFEKAKNVPVAVYIKACEKFEAYMAREIRPKTLNSGKFQVIEVNRDWRLIKATKAPSDFVDSKWQLVSHEKYNKMVDR